MKTTKEKGDELEIVFEKFMKEKLDYSFTERNTFVNGKTAVRAYEVDIHGKKVNKNYQTLQQVGIAIAIFAIVEMFLGIVPEIDIFFEELFTSISPELAGFGLLIVGVIGAVAGYYGKQNSIEHTWVECKNLQSNVKRTHIQKLAPSVEDHNEYIDGMKNASKDEWKADNTIIVSGKDFDIDAKNFAKKHKIECYKLKGKKDFECVVSFDMEK